MTSILKNLLFNKNKNNLEKESDKLKNEFESSINSLLKERSYSMDIINKNQENLRKKHLIKIKNSLDKLYKLYFDKNNFNEESFEFTKNLIKILTDYISLEIIDINNILCPYLNKLLFQNKENLLKIGSNEELLLMNTQIIYCIKDLLKTFTNITILYKKETNFIDECIIPFVNQLMIKLYLYDNFYSAISSSEQKKKNSTEININFDAKLFELIIALFSIENSLNNRESKSIIRRSLLKCLNLENFYTVDISMIEKLLDVLINNLVYYYQKFVLFDINKFLINNSLPKGANYDDIFRIICEDVISYLKFFSMITHCFSKNDIKNYLSNLLFNNFFCEYIQKDIIEISNNVTYSTSSMRVLQFIYYITSYVNNYEICEMLFYFLFGFNYYDLKEPEKKDENSDKKEVLKNILGNDIDDEDLKEIFKTENDLSNQQIQISNNDISRDNQRRISEIMNPTKLKDNIHNMLKGNIGTFSSNVILNIDKNNHNFEALLGFFSLIICSNETDNKIILLSIIANLAKNVSYVFMTELLIPYYLNVLQEKCPKTFDNIVDNLKVSKDNLDLIETLKIIHPKHFSIDSKFWINYFKSNIEYNYKRNLNMLNRVEKINENLGESINESFFGNEMNNFLTLHNISLNDYNSEYVLTTSRDNKNDDILNSISEIKYNGDNSLNYMVNNYTVKMRIKFFKTIVENFLKYVKNSYRDNLFYTKLFLEIASIPYTLNKGENGIKFFNLYKNITFAGKKKKNIFQIGLVGMLYKIRNSLDEKIRTNFTREEIDAFAEKKLELTSDIYNLRKFKDINKDFFKNIKLYNEFYQQFLSNIFTKSCIVQISRGYQNAIEELSDNNNNNKIIKLDYSTQETQNSIINK